MRRRWQPNSVTPTTTTTTTSNKTSTTTKNNNSNNSISCTRLYLIVWCLHLLQPLADVLIFGNGHGALDARPLVTWDIVLIPSVIVLLYYVTKSNVERTAIALAVAVQITDLTIRIYRMPIVWDHEYWALLTNLSFILHFGQSLVGTNSLLLTATTETSFLHLVRLQMGLLYAAATFWKLNSSFFHHKTSCGTILIMELFGAYTFGAIPDRVIQVLAVAAPYLTIAVEAMIGIGMLGVWWYYWGRKRRTDDGRSFIVMAGRNLTVLLATAFHTIIFLMPVNAAGGFSLDCMTRFILFFDSNEIDSCWRTMQKLQHRFTLTTPGGFALPIVLIVLRWLATGIGFDVGFYSAGLLCVLYGCLIVTSHGTPSTHDKVVAPQQTTWIHPVMIVITISYAFIGTILGLQQMGAPTMYANLRSFNGGNHYLVPTAILGDDILFGGGIVQVVYSTCPSINLRLGHIQSGDVFPERVINFLTPLVRQDKLRQLPLQFFPMCMSNPHSRNVLLDLYQASNPPNSPAPVSFRIPISTARQALQEDAENGEACIVKFVDTTPNDTLIVLDSHRGSCEIVVDGGPSQDCGDDDKLANLLLQPPLTKNRTFLQFLVDKLLVPYPELVDMDEEICMS